MTPLIVTSNSDTSAELWADQKFQPFPGILLRAVCIGTQVATTHSWGEELRKLGCLGITKQAQSESYTVPNRASASTVAPPPDMVSVAAIAIYVVLELVESFGSVRACDVSEIPSLLRLDLDLDIAERVSQTLDSELGTISWEEIVTIIGLIARLEDFHTAFEDFHTEFENSQ